MTYSTADPEVPPNLLLNILSTQLPLNQDTVLSGNVSIQALQSNIQDYLSTLLQVRDINQYNHIKFAFI